jgi:hypothetical protein
MAQTTFKTNPVPLEELLKDCGNGKIQLPDFQRSWVWDEDRIKGLLASVSRAFPIGALMTLEMRSGAAETFARRPIEGADHGAEVRAPDALLLDGQQRMTSLYQTCVRDHVVETITARQKLVRHWFYIDMVKALSPAFDREETILGVPEDRKVKENFDRDVVLDLSTSEGEFEQLIFPLNRAFNWDQWQQGFWFYWLRKDGVTKSEIDAKIDLFSRFKDEVLLNFKGYLVPIIALANDTSHEAVCLVFEKVNTGGKPLDAFELVTAMYAAQGYRLRDDWFGEPAHSAKEGHPAKAATLGIQTRLQVYGRFSDKTMGVLEKVASTDFLQAVALLHSRRHREQASTAGVKDSDLPPVRATKQSLLDLPLTSYQDFRHPAEEGFKTAARFLRQLNIFRVADLPYQTQVVSLAAILAIVGPRWENATARAKLAQWYWCGVFGELYGSAVESRFAKDVQEVPLWIEGGPEPATVHDGVFRADRLRTMRTRLSAAYKGIHVLLMREGARDFRSGQTFDNTVFFDEAVDIHHIFPQVWCSRQGIDSKVYDCVINKTPVGARTNRIIGGSAPSNYLALIEKGSGKDEPIASDVLDVHLWSHCIDPMLLRADAFEAFMADRERRLLGLIAKVTGHGIIGADAPPAEGEEVPDDIARDAEPLPIAAE